VGMSLMMLCESFRSRPGGRDNGLGGEVIISMGDGGDVEHLVELDSSLSAGFWDCFENCRRI